MTLSFLTGAKRVGNAPASTPGFLNKAKRVSQAPNEKYPFEEEGDIEREIERNQARSTSRIIEGALGAPGDIANFLSYLVSGRDDIFPGSTKLKELSEKATLGYTAPKTDIEKSGDQLFSDIGSMALPGAGAYGFFRNIGIPIAGTALKEGLKEFGDYSESESSLSKMGLMFALDLAAHRGKGTKAYTRSLFQKAEESIPKGLSVKASELENSLGKLEKTLTAGGTRPTTKEALTKIQEIRSEIKNGKIDLQRLAKFRPSINEAVEALGGFDIHLPKRLKAQAVRNLHDVKSNVINTLTQYGEKFNPEFLKYHQAANQAHAVYENSNKVAKFVKKTVGDKLKSPGAKVLLGISTLPVGALGYASPALAGIAGGAGAIAAGGYQAYKLLYRVLKSPVLRQHYQNILTGALKGNTAQVTKNALLLDKELQKEGPTSEPHPSSKDTQ